MLYISIGIDMNELDIYLYGVPIVLTLIACEVAYSTINNLEYYKLIYKSVIGNPPYIKNYD